MGILAILSLTFIKTIRIFLDRVIILVIKYGVVGVGVGGTFATRAIKEILEPEEVATVEAACSAHEERVKSFASKWGIKKWYTNYRDFLTKSGIDAVIISTPHYLHFPQTIEAIEEGLHVLVDKPIAINLNEADEMIRRAEKKGVKLGVILQSRFDPKLRKIKGIIEEGRLGKLVLGEAYIEWFRTQEYYDKSFWRGRWATEGGGALINQAIHTIDLLIWLMGDVNCLWALIGTMTHNIEVEDLAIATMKFKNGAFGLILGSTALYPGFPHRLEIHGAKGSIIWEAEMIKRISIVGEPEYSEVERAKELESWARPEAVPPKNHAELIRNFTKAIKEDKKPLVDGREGRRSLEVIRAIYHSGRTGEVVCFPFKE